MTCNVLNCHHLPTMKTKPAHIQIAVWRSKLAGERLPVTITFMAVRIRVARWVKSPLDRTEIHAGFTLFQQPIPSFFLIFFAVI